MLKEVTDPMTLKDEELVEKVKEVMEGDDIIANGRLFSSECTRTIGDFGLKKVGACACGGVFLGLSFLLLLARQACFNVITWEPEFTVWKLQDGDHHLILGCDGVWKTVDTQR